MTVLPPQVPGPPWPQWAHVVGPFGQAELLAWCLKHQCTPDMTPLWPGQTEIPSPFDFGEFIASTTGHFIILESGGWYDSGNLL